MLETDYNKHFSHVHLLSLQVGDQLIEINGYSTHNITHTEAIDLIQNGGATVRLKVKRNAKMHPHLGTPSSGSSYTSPCRTLFGWTKVFFWVEWHQYGECFHGKVPYLLY